MNTNIYILAKHILKHFVAYTKFTEHNILSIFTQGQYFESISTDTQAFGIVVPKLLPDGNPTAIISFRGTEQKLKDWMTDLNGFQTVYPYDNINSDIKVHRGFIGAYKSIREQIHSWLDKTRPTQVVLAGHSLGGALATLCAIDIQYNNLVPEIWCFPTGNPKVGNKPFVDSYNKRVINTYRTYLTTDIVPTFPPKWLENVTEKYYHTNKGLKIGPNNPFLGIIRWIKAGFKSERLSADLFNHSLELYVEELDKYTSNTLYS